MKATLLVAGAVLVAGCAFREIKGKPEPAVDAAPALTRPIGLVADTQLHESRGEPSHYLGLGGDEFVPVTIRAGQQVIGAEDVLAAALTVTNSLPLVIHAGDAIDVSCQTEWTRFKRVMTSSERGGTPSATSWLLAPGNHDGLLAGVIFPTESDKLYRKDYWNNLCNAGLLMKEDEDDKKKLETVRSSMAKPKLVKAYVGLLGGNFGSDSKAEGCDDARNLCWVAFAPPKEGWRSFLVQLVKLPEAVGSTIPIYALLLDTSDYESQPYLTTFNAGTQGNLSTDQLSAASLLLSHVPPTARYFFIAHHPASDWRSERWSPEQLAAWGTLLKDPRSLQFLVSAHTHEGSLRENSSALGTFKELNTGSLADAPIYLRTLEFRGMPGGPVGVRSESILVDVNRERCDQLRQRNAVRHATTVEQCERPIAQPDDQDYGVGSQRSESDRAGERGPGLYALFSAIWYFFNRHESKHKELRPQLLAYADIVDETMPQDAQLEFVWTTDEGLNPVSEELSGKVRVSNALRKHANCASGKGKGSVQYKGNLLFAVENYYANSAPATVKTTAQEMRLCLAVSATQDSASGDQKVRKTMESIAEPWSFWLTPSQSN